MKKIQAVIALFLIFFLVGSASAANSKSPAAYLDNFVAGEKIFWFGQVIDVNVYQNKNEVVIEWLCQYLELASPIDIELYVQQENLKKERPPIKVRRTKEQFFVSTLRSPDMPIAVAKEAAEGMMGSKHYVIREAETSFIGQFKGQSVVFIGGGRGTVAGNLEVVYVK